MKNGVFVRKVSLQHHVPINKVSFLFSRTHYYKSFHVKCFTLSQWAIFCDHKNLESGIAHSNYTTLRKKATCFQAFQKWKSRNHLNYFIFEFPRWLDYSNHFNRWNSTRRFFFFHFVLFDNRLSYTRKERTKKILISILYISAQQGDG